MRSCDTQGNLSSFETRMSAVGDSVPLRLLQVCVPFLPHLASTVPALSAIENIPTRSNFQG